MVQPLSLAGPTEEDKKLNDELLSALKYVQLRKKPQIGRYNCRELGPNCTR